MITISSQFDAGNIELVDASNPGHVRLRIRRDFGDRHAQWFYFQLANARDLDCRLVIENAGEMSYPDGFVDYEAVASYDSTSWFRVPTRFDGERLTIEFRPETNQVFFAYFAPYSYERHQWLVATAAESPRVRDEVLCTTPDGRALTLLTIGEPEETAPDGSAKVPVWITARQHPGESMAEWWVEGFLDRLLDAEDGAARALLERAVVYIVPNMNPDGSVRGHLRVNAKGVNLNRAWRDPDPETSPEVFHVRAKMHETGVGFALDVHGDEALPYNFIAGGEGVPRWNDAMQAELDAFKQLLAELAPDFQTDYGYDVDPPGSADLRKCTDYIAESFGCLAMTLEMPFKDAANHPLPELGWSPGRSVKLGEVCLDAIRRTVAGR